MGLRPVKNFSSSHHGNRLVIFAVWSVVNWCLWANTGVSGAELKTEDVTACNISRVVNYSDVCMCTLTEVLCSNKGLKRVPTKIMPMVEILSLANNNIAKINDDDFLKIEYLRVLYLQNNEITSIDPAAFRNFYRLETLNLSNNKLGRLDFAGGVLFQRLLSISRIDLQNSEITQLNKLSFMRIVMSKNVEILLGGNKITCDCNVLALRSWKSFFTPKNVKFTDLVCINDPLNRTYDQFDTSLIHCAGNGSLALTSPADTFTNKHTVDMGNNMEMESPMEQDNKNKLNDAYDVNSVDGVDTSEIRYPLSPVEVSGDENQIFSPSKPNCDQCTNASTNSKCTGTVQCAIAQSMCYSHLIWDPVKRNMTINKGCLTINECYRQEQLNSQQCSIDYLNNKTIQCSFCCIGPACSDGTIGGRVENDLKYVITFVRNQTYQEYMSKPESHEFLREQALIADGIKRLFTDVQGGMDISTVYKQENKNQHRIYLYITLTILSTVAPGEVISILKEDLEKAKSDPHGFLATQNIILDSLYIDVEKNVMCNNDTTVSEKGNITWATNHTGVISVPCPYNSSANASRACLTENSFTFWGPVDDTNCSILAHNGIPNQTSVPGTNSATTSCTAPNCAVKIPTATNCTAINSTETTCIEINSKTESLTAADSTTTLQPTGSPEDTEQTASTESPGTGTGATTETRQTAQTQGPVTETSTESQGTGPSLQTSAIDNSTTAGNSGPTPDKGITGQTCPGVPGQRNCGGIPGQIITAAPTNMTVTNKPSSDNASESSKELLSEIQNTRNFTPEILDKFINTLTSLITEDSLEKVGVVGNVMDSIDSLLQVNDTLLKASDEKTNTSKRLLKVIEYLPEIAPMMNGTLLVVKPHLAVAAIAIDKNETQNVMLVVITEPGQNLTGSEVQLGFQGNSSGATTMTIPSNALIQSLEMDQQEKLQRVAFTVFQSDKLFSTMHASVLVAAKINSNVISASIPGIKIQNLSENITMSFQHQNINSSNPQCVFWKNTPEETQGGWSDEGCVVIESNNLSTTCGCTHLTNFALLMDVYQEGTNLSELDRKILSVISYVGCAISFCALLLTLLTYSCFR